MYMTNISVVVT